MSHPQWLFWVCPYDTTWLQAPYGPGFSDSETCSHGIHLYLPVSIENLLWKVAQVKIFPLSGLHGKELFPVVLNAVYCFSCFLIRNIWQLQLLGFYPSMSRIPWLFTEGIKHIFHNQFLTHFYQWEHRVNPRKIQILNLEGRYLIFNF